MADFSALKTAIQTYIKQNGNEEITGEILQEILLSVVTTLGDSAINDLVTALANEVAARQSADGTLQQNITNEATARGNADTALSNRLGSTITAENTAAAQIGAEAEAREAADTALQGLIDGITGNIENGYVYAGIATPSTTPVTGKVFYLALTAGTYTNFDSTEVSQGINILKYNGSAWSLDAFIGIDDTPTPNSSKLVKSGGAFDTVMTNGSAFDLSAHFASGGTLATYADLSAALAALNTLSASYKRGGMSIKFVSDNMYVQYRCMAQNFTTDTTQWQKQGAEVSISQDSSTDFAIVKIGNKNQTPELASAENYYKLDADINGNMVAQPTIDDVVYGNIASDGNWNESQINQSVILDIKKYRGHKISATGLAEYKQYAFLKSFNIGGMSVFCDGCQRENIYPSNITIPSDCNFIYLFIYQYATPRLPIITISDTHDGLVQEVEELDDKIDVLTDSVDKIEEQIDNINTEVNGNMLPKPTADDVTVGNLTSDGHWNGAPTNTRSLVIDISKYRGHKITVISSYYYQYWAFLKTFNPDGISEFCSGYQREDTYPSNETIPNDCVYITMQVADNVTPVLPSSIIISDTHDGIVFKSNEIDNIVIQGKVNNPIEHIVCNAGLASIFHNITFIGDSLSSGANYDKYGSDWATNLYEYHVYSWCQRMVAMIGGCTGINYSTSGITTRQWIERYWDDEHKADYANVNGDKYFKVDKSQAYCIMLGTNDAGHSVALGSWSTDVDLNDFNNNANTFIGNYAGIIQRIKSVTPSAKIFVITCPLSVAADPDYNNAIKDMANHFSNVFVIDLKTYLPTNSTFVADYVYMGHFTTQGYQYLAYAIAAYIDFIIRNNPASFKYVEIINTRFDDGTY